MVVVNPTFVLGPDDPTRTSMGLVRRFCLGQIPAYVDGALNIVDVRDVATGHLLADERGEVGQRYILGARNFTFDRLFADLARISGVSPPPLKLPTRFAVAGAEAVTKVGLRAPSHPAEIVSASQWWTYRNVKARRELGFDPRPHEETLEDAVHWQQEQLSGRGPRRGPDRLRPARDRPGDESADGMIVLYRCPTRSNVLCPCGAVERRLRKLKLEHRTERVPYRRSSRPEIEELTKQRRVPVLVDGDEVISDSKRIRQYLDFRYPQRSADENRKKA